MKIFFFFFLHKDFTLSVKAEDYGICDFIFQWWYNKQQLKDGKKEEEEKWGEQKREEKVKKKKESKETSKWTKKIKETL